jgi:DNA polymerase-4
MAQVALPVALSDSRPARVRKIIHIDMDAFFASVEQRDNPELRGTPVAVGGSKARGVVAAASYEARMFGVKSAMPSVTAARQCPDLVFVPPRFEAYRLVSQQIREIFAEYTDLIEPLSLDEAYLDVSEDRRGIGSARATAQQIRARIFEVTGLTASAGVSYNKFIAKLASDQNKPDGMCVIPPQSGAAFVASLPVRRFHGVGPVTAAKMEHLDIRTGADLCAQSLEYLQAHFGSSASYLFNAARGRDDRPVQSHRATKSVGAERTFETDLTDRNALMAALDRVTEAAWTRIERHGIRGRRVTLKVRFSDFHTITRARSTIVTSDMPASFRDAGVALLETMLPTTAGIRLLGLTLSGIEQGDVQTETRQPPLPL